MAPEETSSSGPGRRPGDRTRIAVVDDHPAVRQGLSAFLAARPGYEVCGEAQSPAEAMGLVATAAPEVLIIDLSLEDGSGLELVKQIRARFAGVRMLVYSMHDELLYAERVIRAGALGFVSKSVDLATLGEAVDRVRQGKIYLSERMTAVVLERGLRGGEAVELPSPADLTDRELEVFEAIGRGLSTREVAERLHLSVKTVETHRENIKRKLGLAKNMELLQRAFHWMMEQE